MTKDSDAINGVNGSLAMATQNGVGLNLPKDPFWDIPTTDPQKWDKYCPYQLLILEAQETQDEAPLYKIKHKFTLPLPPKSITISAPFASVVTPTLGGIVEENSGIVFRMIQFRGTMGVLPGKDSGIDKSGLGAVQNLESIFAGTVTALSGASRSATQAISSLTNDLPVAFNVHKEAEFTEGSSSTVSLTTGFWQLAKLREFLEGYANAKKHKEYKNYRLAVAIWKEDQVFLATPVSFDVSKDAGSPLEYIYNLTFKAWKRIKLEAGASSVTFGATAIRKSPNYIARALSTLLFARQAVQQVGSLKQAIPGDIDYVLSPIHDAILLCKDTLGAGLSLAETPLAVRQRAVLNWEEIKQNSQSLWAQILSFPDQAWGKLKSTFADSPGSDGTGNTIKGVSHGGQVRRDIKNPNSLSSKYSQVHTDRRSSGLSSPQVTLDKIPPGLAAVIPLSALGLPQDVRKIIESDIQRVRGLKRKDFESRANSLKLLHLKLCALFGVGDPEVNALYDLDVVPIKSEPNSDDWVLLNAIENSIVVMEQFAATSQGEPTEVPTLLERFGGLAVSDGLAWTQPVSKFSIPFPYGATLEEIAAKYLGSADRTLEIIALNGLKAPYIDEVGYTLPLVTNGAGGRITVSYNTDLFVGKKIWLSSRTVVREERTIEDLQRNGSVLYLSLSGDQDLDRFKVVDNAILETFLSGTINSRNMLWIPSQRQPVGEDDIVTKSIPGVDTLDPWFGVGGVDLLLDSENDIVLAEDNDLRFAYGMANITQWLREVISIQQGEVLEHKEIGLPLSIGLSLAEFNPKQVSQAIRTMLSNDDTFTRIDNIRIQQTGATVKIDITPVVTGTTQPVPLSFGVSFQ